MYPTDRGSASHLNVGLAMQSVVVGHVDVVAVGR